MDTPATRFDMPKVEKGGKGPRPAPRRADSDRVLIERLGKQKGNRLRFPFSQGMKPRKPLAATVRAYASP